MLTSSQVIAAFKNLTVWKKDGHRAPHKPLLALYALSRLSATGANDFYYRDVEPLLVDLLKQFGPPRATYHPEAPFWRLQNDGVWIVDNATAFTPDSKGNVTARALRDQNACAHFPPEIAQILRNEPETVAQLFSELLYDNFPPLLDSVIRDALYTDVPVVETAEVVARIPVFETVTRRRRDAAFRKRILLAYEQSCAVCRFDVKMKSRSIALDAAHIKWHQAGGPDSETNGLALCLIHHNAFDMGAFTIRPNGIMVVSRHADGTNGLNEWLLRYHGSEVQRPRNRQYFPNEKFLDWHVSEVFKGPHRDLP